MKYSILHRYCLIHQRNTMTEKVPKYFRRSSFTGWSGDGSGGDPAAQEPTNLLLC